MLVIASMIGRISFFVSIFHFRPFPVDPAPTEGTDCGKFFSLLQNDDMVWSFWRY
jgi:hypothetical protein